MLAASESWSIRRPTRSRSTTMNAPATATVPVSSTNADTSSFVLAAGVATTSMRGSASTTA